jgi:hypothetical protein
MNNNADGGECSSPASMPSSFDKVQAELNGDADRNAQLASHLMVSRIKPYASLLYHLNASPIMSYMTTLFCIIYIVYRRCSTMHVHLELIPSMPLQSCHSHPSHPLPAKACLTRVPCVGFQNTASPHLHSTESPALSTIQMHQRRLPSHPSITFCHAKSTLSTRRGQDDQGNLAACTRHTRRNMAQRTSFPARTST